MNYLISKNKESIFFKLNEIIYFHDCYQYTRIDLKETSIKEMEQSIKDSLNAPHNEDKLTECLLMLKKLSNKESTQKQMDSAFYKYRYSQTIQNIFRDTDIFDHLFLEKPFFLKDSKTLSTMVQKGNFLNEIKEFALKENNLGILRHSLFSNTDIFDKELFLNEIGKIQPFINLISVITKRNPELEEIAVKKYNMFEFVQSENLFDYVFENSIGENLNIPGLYALSTNTDKYDSQIIKLDVPMQVIYLIAEKSNKYDDYLVESLKVYTLPNFKNLDDKIILRIEKVILNKEEEKYPLISGIFHKFMNVSNKHNNFISENLEVCHYSVLSQLLDKDFDKYVEKIYKYPDYSVRVKITQQTDKYDQFFIETTSPDKNQDYNKSKLIDLIYNKKNVDNKFFLKFDNDSLKIRVLSNTDKYDQLFLKDKSYQVRLALLRKKSLPVSNFIYDNNSNIIREIKSMTNEFNDFFKKRIA